MTTPLRPERVEPGVEVRSFHAVFDLERRIYRVDRLRLNPAGVPVRGVLYFLAVVVLFALLARIPLLGWPIAHVPWFIRFLAAPGAVSALLAIIRIDGRPFHSAVVPMVRLMLAPRSISRFSACPREGSAWMPSRIVLVPDGSDPSVRDFSYRGPGAALILCEHRPPQRSRRALTVRGLPSVAPLARGRFVRVPAGSLLRVRRARP